MTASQIISLVFGVVGAISWASIAYNTIQTRQRNAEMDITGVAKINRRLIGNAVRFAVCKEHESCVHCEKRRDEAARLIEGR